MKMKWFPLLSLSCLFLLVSYQLSFGAEGKIVIKPHIDVSWQADSNFWWAETNEQEVFTYLAQPGVTFGYQTDKTLIQLDYTMNGYVFPTPVGPVIIMF